MSPVEAIYQQFGQMYGYEKVEKNEKFGIILLETPEGNKYRIDVVEK